MTSFIEFLAARGRAEITPAPLLHSRAAVGFATPNREDTRRAIERAKKRGRFVTVADLTNAISPESGEAATKGVMVVSRRPSTT